MAVLLKVEGLYPAATRKFLLCYIFLLFSLEMHKRKTEALMEANIVMIFEFSMAMKI